VSDAAEGLTHPFRPRLFWRRPRVWPIRSGLRLCPGTGPGPRGIRPVRPAGAASRPTGERLDSCSDLLLVREALVEADEREQCDRPTRFCRRMW